MDFYKPFKIKYLYKLNIDIESFERGDTLNSLLYTKFENNLSLRTMIYTKKKKTRIKRTHSITDSYIDYSYSESLLKDCINILYVNDIKLKRLIKQNDK